MDSEITIDWSKFMASPIYGTGTTLPTWFPPPPPPPTLEVDLDEWMNSIDKRREFTAFELMGVGLSVSFMTNAMVIYNINNRTPLVVEVKMRGVHIAYVLPGTMWSYRDFPSLYGFPEKKKKTRRGHRHRMRIPA